VLEKRTHHGVSLSSIGIGTWAIGGPYWTADQPTGWSGPLNDDDSKRGIMDAINGGISHIDTADVYGIGRSERIVGDAIYGRRTQISLASKVGFVSTSAPSVYSAENIKFQCEQSLRNLKTECLDIYYIHHCDFGPNDLYLPEAVDTIKWLQQAGHIRAVGLSGYSSRDLIRIATILKPDFIQSWASIEHREFINEDGDLSKFMLANDIKFIAMMPFGQGRILGKYDSMNPPIFGKGDNRTGNPEFQKDSLKIFQPKLEKIKEKFGQTSAELIVPALGFLLQFPTVVSVIPGFRNSDQVADILRAASRTFTYEDRRFIESVFPISQSEPHPWSE
jgi:myo-inositol catabolism protein IolS